MGNRQEHGAGEICSQWQRTCYTQRRPEITRDRPAGAHVYSAKGRLVPVPQRFRRTGRTPPILLPISVMTLLIPDNGVAYDRVTSLLDDARVPSVLLLWREPRKRWDQDRGRDNGASEHSRQRRQNVGSGHGYLQPGIYEARPRVQSMRDRMMNAAPIQTSHTATSFMARPPGSVVGAVPRRLGSRRHRAGRAGSGRSPGRAPQPDRGP